MFVPMRKEEFEEGKTEIGDFLKKNRYDPLTDKFVPKEEEITESQEKAVLVALFLFALVLAYIVWFF